MNESSVENPDSQNQPVVIRADERLRRRSVGLVLLIILPGVAILWMLQVRLEAIREIAETNLDEAIAHAVEFIETIAWVAGLSFVGMAVWFARLAWQIHRTGQYPPAGMKVIRDTRLRTGASALTIGMVATAGALFFIVVGTAGMWWMYRMAIAVLQS